MKMKGKHASLILISLHFFVGISKSKTLYGLEITKIVLSLIDMDHGFHWSK